MACGERAADDGVRTRTFTSADFKVTGIDRADTAGVSSLVFHLANADLKADLKVTLGKDEPCLQKQLASSASMSSR